ncbi:MAG: type I 3-dehydroquinate dehydratase [Candidatus Omnitrophica bacterium]|nr:type I 3-dehydroquinate dehydratase [Candidatus Omnitrophota bacterium]
MIKIGNLTLNGMPRVAIAVSDKERNSSIASRNIDIVEIRLDQFERLDVSYIRENIAARRDLNLPLILTIRSIKEGGKKSISNGFKSRLFKDIISLVDAVDIELRSSLVSTVTDIAKRNKKIIVISWHDFKSTPNDKILTNILNEAKAKGAHIVKIATKANNAEDVNRLMKFTQKNKSKNIITIALGNIGAISRLSFPMAGSLITYSYINKPSGLGQIPLDVLQEQLRLFYPQYNQHIIEKSGLIESA